jgi:transcriptional regulator with XRE-family HTH domain
MENADIEIFRQTSINIRNIRLLKNYKQYTMAKMLGISINAYSRMERGMINYSVVKLIKISIFYDMEISQLISFHQNVCLNKNGCNRDL